MRSLSGTNLESNQSGVGVTGLGYDPIWKIVLTRDGQDTKTYTKTRITSISHIEEEYNQNATVLLGDSDNTLKAIDFELYEGVLSYGYNDPSNGEEYSPCAPLYVVSQRQFSAQGLLVCQLTLEGIPNRLAKDLAESEYTQTDGDTQTVKDLLTAIANASLAPYSNYVNYTINFDSIDSIIDSFQPKEAFHVSINTSRLSKMQELLSWTGCKMRVGDDGEIHVFDPTTSGSYVYEYKLAVTSSHTFFNKELRNRFVNPNKEVVESHPSHIPHYSSSATSSTSYALSPQVHTTYARLASDDDASDIAIAKIESYELDAEKGAVAVPMNVGQEVWDWIKVTDQREDDDREGNVRYIKRTVRVPGRDGRMVFDMEVRFGTGGTVASPALMIASVTTAPANRDVGTVAALALYIGDLQDAFQALNQDINRLFDKMNEVVAVVNSLGDEMIVKKLIVTDEFTAPSRGD